MNCAFKFIGKRVESYKEGVTIEDEYINELVQYHPTKSIDVSEVEWFKLCEDKYRTLCLCYKYYGDDKIDDIGWKKCIRNLYDAYNPDEDYKNCVNKAFRNEVHYGTKCAFFVEHTTLCENGRYRGQCEACNTMSSPTTDHKDTPFCVILERFLEEQSLRLEDLYTRKNEQFEIWLQDRSLATRWLKYHDEHAKYRILCRSCNSRIGSRG